jgi:hypothetical protein
MKEKGRVFQFGNGSLQAKPFEPYSIKAVGKPGGLKKIFSDHVITTVSAGNGESHAIDGLNRKNFEFFFLI